MDQAERLRNLVKQNNVNTLEENQADQVVQEVQTKPAEHKKAQVITVTSGKGGVGKSSVSINLAIQLQKRGKNVIIFDADFGLANIEVMFGAVPQYNLSDVIFRGKDIREVIVKGPLEIGFISGGSGINGLGNMNREQVLYLVETLKKLETMADVIIIDTGAGISDSVIEFVLSSAEVLLVTTPEPTSITDSYALLKTLNARAGDDLDDMHVKLIANRVSGEEEAKNLYNKLNVVVNKFLKLKLEYLGMVPWDTNMSKSVMQQKPISIAYPNSEGAKAISRVAERILGIQEQREEKEEKKKGIAAAIMKMLKNKKN
ncbi:MAG: MinD/ParA family protein [Lachnospiraceae bacterium]|nr:MinD/ParA family protein [Lachnospiraceae bacterium]